MKRKMKRFYKDSSLLSKRKVKNIVFVWNGNGYNLTPIYTRRDSISIEEIAYICCKSNKGLFVTEEEMDQMIKDEDVYVNEYREIEGFCHCDLSSYRLQNGYLLIQHMRNKGVEIYG